MRADAAVTSFAQIAVEAEQLERRREAFADEPVVQVRSCSSTALALEMPVIVDVINGEEPHITFRAFRALALVAVGFVDPPPQESEPNTHAPIDALSACWARQFIASRFVLPSCDAFGGVGMTVPPIPHALIVAVPTRTPIPLASFVDAGELLQGEPTTALPAILVGVA